MPNADLVERLTGFDDVENRGGRAALNELGKGVIALDNAGANIKFGGYMMGGVDDTKPGR